MQLYHCPCWMKADTTNHLLSATRILSNYVCKVLHLSCVHISLHSEPHVVCVAAQKYDSFSMLHLLNHLLGPSHNPNINNIRVATLPILAIFTALGIFECPMEHTASFDIIIQY